MMLDRTENKNDIIWDYYNPKNKKKLQYSKNNGDITSHIS